MLHLHLSVWRIKGVLHLQGQKISLHIHCFSTGHYAVNIFRECSAHAGRPHTWWYLIIVKILNYVTTIVQFVLERGPRTFCNFSVRMTFRQVLMWQHVSQKLKSKIKQTKFKTNMLPSIQKQIYLIFTLWLYSVTKCRKTPNLRNSKALLNASVLVLNILTPSSMDTASPVRLHGYSARTLKVFAR